eukprot:TRINITY_DN13222_c0_g2_i1.p1 TRINITY_DN13222_c0_g2~~TRINITY_DN13222_c0_g2_i1.p1  ORF type:complete len:177 (+),score=48.17 TRINITY_DN13222_c0_g2_i1:70-600(+)
MGASSAKHMVKMKEAPSAEDVLAEIEQLQKELPKQRAALRLCEERLEAPEMQPSFLWWRDSREQRQEVFEHESAKLVHMEDLLFFLRCQASTHACTAAAFIAWKYARHQVQDIDRALGQLFGPFSPRWAQLLSTEGSCKAEPDRVALDIPGRSAEVGAAPRQAVRKTFCLRRRVRT